MWLQFLAVLQPWQQCLAAMCECQPQHKKAVFMFRTRSLLLWLALVGTVTHADEEMRLLWGDTHLHTALSSDAFVNGNRDMGPDTAYRYARGLPVVNPYHRARVQIDTPLDFLVVSDHAEFLGMLRHIYFEGVDTSQVGPIDTLKGKLAGWLLRTALDNDGGLTLFSKILPLPQDPREAAAEAFAKGPSGLPWVPLMPQVEVDAWRQITEAADRYNAPGEFTALIGWEWSSIPGGANLHRVVMTDADANVAQQFRPLGTDDTPYPEDLWTWLDKTSAITGADFISIPHNSNISKGFMFDTNSLRGEAFTPEYIALRSKWEMVAEITQIKGDSEVHPDLSPDDEFADFENYPFYIEAEPPEFSARPGDFIRSALLRGLQIERELGSNPYRFGVVGSTDAHTALPSAEEHNFHGKLATDSIPEGKGEKWGDHERTPFGWGMSASGLAAVWAEDNTREAIWAAMKRREVYATTGPRIGVKFYGGWDYSEQDLSLPDLRARATVRGVPMGGKINAPGNEVTAPTFMVLAARDPATANLDRIQMVKGWLDASGSSHEKVYDIAWSGLRESQPNGKLPAVGNTVNRETAAYDNSIGAPQLHVVWQDPDFNRSQPAFYYIRVLEIPTPRHSLYDAVALGSGVDTGRPDTLQERAYTSPIWYHPNELLPGPEAK